MKDISIGVLGFIGGLVAALITAGVLFPPRDWSPELTKTATSRLKLNLPAADYDREVLIQGEFIGIAQNETTSRIWLHIMLNGEECNEPDTAFVNPAASDKLLVTDFCTQRLEEGLPLNINLVPRELNGVDSEKSKLTVFLRRAERSLF